MATLSYVGYVLALIGGVILVIVGLLSIIGSPFIALWAPLSGLGTLIHGIVLLIIGVVCVIGSKYVAQLTWAIILLVLGIIAGGIGGLLVLLGALLGLISRLTRT